MDKIFNASAKNQTFSKTPSTYRFIVASIGIVFLAFTNMCFEK
jgi:hypothetical protein